MGEFTVDAPLYDGKMGETTSQKPYLEVSVSFGRFENDSLAWEKWSTFSPNKYLEEVEKCATPGSVAQKKAYFEAHYKKIAAKKAELLAQEGKIENVPLRLDVQNGENLSNDNSTSDSTTLNASNNLSSSTEEVKQETDLSSEVNSAGMCNPAEDVAVTTECENSTADDGEAEEEKKDIESGSDSKTSNHEGAVCVQRQETSIGETEDIKELQVDADNGISKVSDVKMQNAKLDRRKESKKMPLVNKERDAAKSKNVLSPRHKTTPISPQRAPRVIQTPRNAVSSGSSTKRGNSPMLSSSRSQYTPTAASKPHKSLHMSLNLSASNPGSASPVTAMRKSFILEKMGDKDIVKRVFKTFQSNLNQSNVFVEDGSSVKKKVPTRGSEVKTSASMIGQKENGRRTKVNDVNKTGVTTVTPTLDLKSDARTEKRKEKMVEKSNSKVAERASLLSKSQVGKESEIKKVRQSMKIKSTTMPGSYQKQKLSQSTTDKGTLKTGIHR